MCNELNSLRTVSSCRLWYSWCWLFGFCYQRVSYE